MFVEPICFALVLNINYFFYSAFPSCLLMLSTTVPENSQIIVLSKELSRLTSQVHNLCKMDFKSSRKQTCGSYTNFLTIAVVKMIITERHLWTSDNMSSDHLPHTHVPFTCRPFFIDCYFLFVLCFNYSFYICSRSRLVIIFVRQM
jgi:hypothetical protein